MFISDAIAQTTAVAPAGAQTSLLMGYMPIIIIFFVFYFLFIRPQNRRMKEHQILVKSLRRGDKIVTNSGIYGEITKVNDDESLMVQIAEGVIVRLGKGYVASVDVDGNRNDTTRAKTSRPQSGKKSSQNSNKSGKNGSKITKKNKVKKAQ